MTHANEPDAGELTGDELAVLLLADKGLQGGELANAIRELGLSDIAFYRKLNWLIDTEKALRTHAVLANRLRRVRDARSAVRRG